MLTPSFLDATGVTLYVPGTLAAEIIADLTASGDVTEAVDYWRKRLGFHLPDEDAARAFLVAAGIEDVSEMDSDTLERYVLWLAAPDGIFDDATAFADSE